MQFLSHINSSHLPLYHFCFPLEFPIPNSFICLNTTLSQGWLVWYWSCSYSFYYHWTLSTASSTSCFVTFVGTLSLVAVLHREVLSILFSSKPSSYDFDCQTDEFLVENRWTRDSWYCSIYVTSVAWADFDHLGFDCCSDRLRFVRSLTWSATLSFQLDYCDGFWFLKLLDSLLYPIPKYAFLLSCSAYL